MFNYYVEAKTPMRDLPVTLSEWVDSNRSHYLYTTVEDDVVITLSRVFHEEDMRRLAYLNKEVRSYENEVNLYGYS